jgi:trans-L-3-hydroxyproline dehydratase
MEVSTLDYHTAGEPLRIVTAGLPDIAGRTMLEKRRFFREELDAFRRFLMLEPRGHADMYGAVLTEAVTADGDFGVLFLHNDGYSTMCGHGIIAAVTAGLERGLFTVSDEACIRIDTPAGRVTARAQREAQRESQGRVQRVSFLNVPSFVAVEEAAIQLDGHELRFTLAFGGAFYAYLDAEPMGLRLEPAEASRLVSLGRAVKAEVEARDLVRHPAGDPDLEFLYGTVFVLQGEKPRHSRNVCIFADGELDRSPTGTGVSGRAAIEHASGRLPLGETLTVESIIGTSFRVRCVEETRVGELPAVVPEVTGSAHICGEHHFILDPQDPLRDGFMLR